MERAGVKSSISTSSSAKSSKLLGSNGLLDHPLRHPCLSLPESLFDQITTGYEVEKKLVMMTTSEFETKFGTKASELPHLPWQSMIDETGQPVRALLLEHPTDPLRTVKFRSLTGLRLDRMVANPSEMLRPKQSEALMSQLLKAGNHKCPATGGLLSMQSLQARVMEEMQKKADAAVGQAAAAPEAALAGDTEMAAGEATVVNLVNPSYGTHCSYGCTCSSRRHTQQSQSQSESKGCRDF